MKGVTFSAGMAADLTVVEDQRQSVGQKADHGQHHQGGGLVDRRVLEVTVDGEGVKDFGIDSPTTATELRNEQGGDRTEFEIGGVEVGAGLRHHGFDQPALGDRRRANRDPANASIESPALARPELR